MKKSVLAAVHAESSPYDKNLGLNTLISTLAREADVIFPVGATEESPESHWGTLYKGAGIDKRFDSDIKELRARFDLNGTSHSIAVGVMQPYAFHRPYLRHIENNTGGGDKGALRVYRIIAGSFVAVVDGKAREFSYKNDYIIIPEGTVFSFQAGKEGCVFGLIDFPAFEMGDDVNDVQNIAQSRSLTA